MDDLIDRALAEDVGDGDLTTRILVPPDARATARIEQKEPGVIAGLDVAAAVFERFDVRLEPAKDVVARLDGPAAGILTAERTALNFLGRLSGIATLTARYVEAVEGTGAKILDTRKTTPGLRELEKAAVAAGGGHEPPDGPLRRGDDQGEPRRRRGRARGGHAQGGRRGARGRRGVRRVRDARGRRHRARGRRAPAAARQHDPGRARRVRRARRRPRDLEASGGVTLENVREIAETGVDFISVGALTHSAPALDLSLLFD